MSHSTMNYEKIIHYASAAGYLSELAAHYYSFFKRIDPDCSEQVLLCGVLLVHRGQTGHSCLNFEEFAGKLFSEFLTEEGQEWISDDFRFPVASELSATLQKSVLVGQPGESVPILNDQNERLYLYRFWDYEKRLADNLNLRAQHVLFDTGEIKKQLNRVFVSSDCHETDWQKVAVSTAAMQRLCIISGGPGTGKTYTVVKIIALLQLLSAPVKLDIALAAPTGKAASRLQESIKAVSSNLDLPIEIISSIPEQAKTIHRLLGPIRYTPHFRFNKLNKLSCDILIVDEVSMVDLALMVKLCEAMPVKGHLILLGDNDQLSSVEAGRVLADICSQSKRNRFSVEYCQKLNEIGVGGKLVAHVSNSYLQDCIVFLTKSYRFSEESGIGKLAEAIKSGSFKEAWDCFTTERDLQLISSNEKNLLTDLYVESSMAERVCNEYGAYLQISKGSNPGRVFKAFSRFQVLCAHRRGLAGVQQVNRWIEALLLQSGHIDEQGEWYIGKPVIITGNHYDLDLYNGDIGIALLDQHGRMRIFFKKANNEFRDISPARMPEYQTAFALTVHKSQGSEFEAVLLILPEKVSPIISRELLYTAITRAKESFILSANQSVFKEGVKRQTQRYTGLAKRIKSSDS